MRKLIVFCFALACAAPAALFAQPELYSFPEVDDSKIKNEEAIPPQPFVIALSKKMDIPEAILTGAVEKGFGRLELIRLILMAKKAPKPLPDLIQDREKGTRMAKIAESLKLNNSAIKKEAVKILNALEEDVKKIKLEAERSSGAAKTAGVNSPHK